jgi:hypothetical protein
MVGYFLYPAPVQRPHLAACLLELVNASTVDQSRIRVQPAQISFVACTLARGNPFEKPDSTAALVFRGNSAAVTEKEYLREYLLFYCYADSRLELLGHMPLARYNRDHREDYITLGDVDRPELELAYELEEDAVLMMRQLKPYYNPSRPLPDLNFQELGNLIYCEVAKPIGSLLLRPDVLAARTGLVEYLLQQFLGAKSEHAVVFAYLLVVAGIDPDYAKLFVRRETQLLEVRLNRYWTGERLRAVFCNSWFRGMIEVCPVTDSRSQFPLFPFPEDLIGSSEKASIKFTERCREKLGWQAASPGLQFRLSTLFLSSVNAGPGSFCFQELVPHLSSALGRRLKLQISELQLRYNLCLYRKLYLPTVRDAQWNVAQLHDARKDRFTERLARSERQPVLDLLGKFKLLPQDFSYLYPKFDRLLMHWRILPSVNELYGISSLGPEFSQEQNLITEEEDERRERELAAKSGHLLSAEHRLPESREEALLYSQRFWPACMRRMLEQSYGVKHLVYTERLSCSGMLKSFGYTLQQAEKLWEYFFIATTVYTADFKSQEHGRALVTDYTKAKQGGCGNCRTLASKGVCPFGDMEDFGQRCAADLNAQTGRTAQYPISSPLQYFKMALNAGSPRSDE